MKAVSWRHDKIWRFSRCISITGPFLLNSALRVSSGFSAYTNTNTRTSTEKAFHKHFNETTVREKWKFGHITTIHEYIICSLEPFNRQILTKVGQLLTQFPVAYLSKFIYFNFNRKGLERHL